MNQDRPQNISFGNQIGDSLIQTPHGTDGQRVENINLLMSDLLNMNFQNLPPGNIAIGNRVGGNIEQIISNVPQINSPISVSHDGGKFALINDGQLYLGKNESDKLTNIQFDHPVINVYRSNLRIGVVTADGNCYIWKNKKNSQPEKVDLGYPYRAKKIVLSSGFSCLLLEDGTIAFWGIYASQEYNLKMNFSAIDIATGKGVFDEFMAITKNGKAYHWGSTSVLEFTLPEQAKLLTFPEPIITAVIGSEYTLVLSRRGNIYAFNNNYENFDFLRQGKKIVKSKEPVKINLPEPIKHIASTGFGSLAIGISGRLFVFGEIHFEIDGVIDEISVLRGLSRGYYIYKPVEVSIGQPVEYIDGSSDLTIAITKDGNFNFLKQIPERQKYEDKYPMTLSSFSMSSVCNRSNFNV